MTRSLRPELSRPHESTLHRTAEGVIGSALDAAQVAYAAEVGAYNSSVASAMSTGAPRPDLMSKFSGLFPEDRGDREVSAIWQMVSAMASIEKDKPKASAPSDWRATSAGCRAVASAARQYLERSYKRYVQSTVHSNLREAQLGGVPGTFHLVRSYLRIRLDGASTTGLEDGSYEGAPVWAAVYHCLRCGDRAAAASVAANAGPGLAEALKLLNEVAASPDGRLSQHSEHMVITSICKKLESV